MIMMSDDITLLEDGVYLSNSFGIIQKLGTDEGKSVFGLYNRDDIELSRTTDLRIVRDWLRK